MEKNKRKHFINLFDIIFIILIIAVAGAAYYMSHSDDTQAETRNMTYVVELSGLEENMQNCVSVGDAVTDNVKNYAMGTVTAVEIQPYLVSVTDEENNIVRQTEEEGYVTLLLTIEAPVSETDTAITTESGYTLRVGTSVSVKVGTLVSAGYILSLDA